MNPMIPPPEPARHGINETLALIDSVRALAFIVAGHTRHHLGIVRKRLKRD